MIKPKDFYFKYNGVVNDIPTLAKELGMKNDTNRAYEEQGEIIEQIRPDVYEVSTFENEGTLEVLKIADLVLSQKYLNWDKFIRYRAVELDFPLHVTKRKDGKLVLEDGYTRTFLKVLLKQETVEAYVLDVSQYERKNYVVIPKEHENLKKIKEAATQMRDLTVSKDLHMIRIALTAKLDYVNINKDSLPEPAFSELSYVEFERIFELENGWRFKTIG